MGPAACERGGGLAAAAPHLCLLEAAAEGSSTRQPLQAQCNEALNLTFILTLILTTLTLTSAGMRRSATKRSCEAMWGARKSAQSPSLITLINQP